jgi:hypothetical protein
MPQVSKAQEYRVRAEECRRKAEGCSTAIEKEHWSKMAVRASYPILKASGIFRRSRRAPGRGPAD